MHLILDYRMDYVEQHLKELQASLSTESDLNKTMEIMGENKEDAGYAQRACTQIGKRYCGVMDRK